MVEPDISYEEFIPTDKFAVQDMYLMRIHRMSLVYQRLMRGWYNGRLLDQRAMIDFYALADDFYFFAQQNIEKHLNLKKDIELLQDIFENGKQKYSVEEARTIFKLFQKFAHNSKLTDLSAKRWIGDFANARKHLGIDKAGGQ